MPTASGFEAGREYIADTAKMAVATATGVAKLTPAYSLYRAVIGNPIKPKEYAMELLTTGLNTVGLVWRVQPAAPIAGWGLNTWVGVRRYVQGKIDSEELVSYLSPQGINQTPSIGALVTDNIKWAEAIDIAFMATMFIKPFLGKRLSELKLSANELKKASETLGIKPDATMEEVSMAVRQKIRSYPDAFTLNPDPISMAARKEITDALNIFKKAGILDKKFAAAMDFIQEKLNIKFEPFKVEGPPKQLTAPQTMTTEELSGLKGSLKGREEKPGGIERATQEIQAGVSPPVKVRTIEGGEKVIEDGGHRVAAYEKLGIAEVPVEDVTSKYPQPVAVTPEPKAPVKVEAPKPVTKPSKIAKSIETKSVEAKLTKGFEHLAEYTPVTIKAQAKHATELVNTDLEKARSIIRGETPLPDNVKGVSLITAMEEHILKYPDAELAYELANSPLVSGTSTAAQELRLAAERVPDSLAAKLQEVKQAKRQAMEKRYNKKAPEAIKEEVVKIKKEINVPDKYDWGAFIQKLEC